VQFAAPGEPDYRHREQDQRERGRGECESEASMHGQRCTRFARAPRVAAFFDLVIEEVDALQPILGG